MINFRNLYRTLLKFPLSILVKTKSIQQNPVEELELDLCQPIIYVLPYTSQSDLVILRNNCLKLGLPDPTELNHIGEHRLPRFVFLDDGKNLFQSKEVKEDTKDTFYQYLALHENFTDLNVQVMPVSVLWGRSPGHENKQSAPRLRLLNGIQKFFAILWFGRDTFVFFSPPMLMRNLVQQGDVDLNMARKLSRVARIHFAKQRVSATGPKLPDRDAMFEKILTSSVLTDAIADEARSKKISIEKANKEARKILDEIAADVSYESLRLADRFLGWLWNKLYQGISVQHGERIRKLAREGHEIVYVPCHRSHIDYLLLSYVLYAQGLFPPHIAAGINLNFWPVGALFRRGGAFFIRRTFKGNRLYSVVFREYLRELFYRGYSVEFFIEGGRSRTGRLLAPKTGMISMTLQALQNSHPRPITIVPVYIGYEHVLEVDTYSKELRGADKEKENARLVLRVLKKLRNLGKGYVNFGAPITLTHYLNEHFPDWKEGNSNEEKPQWFVQAVDKVSQQIMININNAAAVNAMNLTVTALLASRQRALSKEDLLQQLDSYQQLLQNAPYSEDCILPTERPDEMLNHVLNLNKVGILLEKDNFGEIVRLERKSAVLMTYYRNNIQHLFILPGLIAAVVLSHEAIQRELVLQAVHTLYPFLKSELFLHLSEEELNEQVGRIITELCRQEMIKCNEKMLMINRSRLRVLQLLAAVAQETLQRYFIILSLLQTNPTISRTALEKESQSVAQRLSVLQGINAPEFFDRAVIANFINTLREENYIDLETGAIERKVDQFASILSSLITLDVNLTIQSAVEKQE